MAKIYKTTFKFRRGVAEEWKEVNPILNAGEPGYEIDTGKLKIGNGKDAWKELKYVGEDTHVEVASKLDEKGVEQVRLIKVNNAKHADSATTADKWSTPRKVEMTGDVLGQILSWDGGDLVIELSVVDDSHNHTIENINGLEDALLLKAPLQNPKFTGIPTAPTAEKEVANTQIATTAFVHNAIPKTLKNPYKLQLAGKEYDGSASVTIDKESLQGFLEITNIIHFLGTATKLPTSGNRGDLIIVNEKGYIWVNDDWFELGGGGGGTTEFEDNDTTYVFKELSSKTGFSVTSYVNGVSKETKTLNFDVYTKSQTDTAIAAAVVNSSHLKRQILKEGEKLEDISKPDTNTIYMVRKHAFSTGDIYEEYMYIDGEFELIGNSFVNLSDYYTKEKIDSLFEDSYQNILIEVDALYGNRMISGNDGLNGGGSISGGDIVISHAVPTNAKVNSLGLYKIATDKFGHAISLTEVKKEDLTKLGIPSQDTNNWRNIKVNGTEVHGTGIYTGALEFSIGSSNGSISIGGKDVLVKGLTETAYTELNSSHWDSPTGKIVADYCIAEFAMNGIAIDKVAGGKGEWAMWSEDNEPDENMYYHLKNGDVHLTWYGDDSYYGYGGITSDIIFKGIDGLSVTAIAHEYTSDIQTVQVGFDEDYELILDGGDSTTYIYAKQSDVE